MPISAINRGLLVLLAALAPDWMPDAAPSDAPLVLLGSEASDLASKETGPKDSTPKGSETNPRSTESGMWGDLRWTDLDGKEWSAQSLLGKVVVLDFWATWCPPCLAEIPRLKKIRDQHGERLVVIGVALDSLDRRRLGAFLHRQGVTWPQVHEPKGFQSELAGHFAVESLPATRMIDPRGRLVASGLRGQALELAVSGLISVTAESP